MRRSRLMVQTGLALAVVLCSRASATPAVARDPFAGTSHTVTQNPDGTFDVVLSTTVVTQPTTFTVIGAATDRLNLVEIQAGVPQLVFVEIRGSAGGAVQSVQQIDMGASTSTVLIRDLRTSGDVGSIFVNTIVNMSIGGNLTGGINLLPRSSGGNATLIDGLISGRVLGDVVVDHGDILSLTVTQGIGIPGNPVQVRTSGNLVKLIAGEIHADVSTLSGGPGGYTSELRTTTGPFVGSLSSRGLNATEPGSISLIDIATDLDANVQFTEDIASANAGLPVVQIGNQLAPGRTLEIGRSLLSGAEIRISSAAGLGGQILINSEDAGGSWGGGVRVGGSLLGPVPEYTATSGALGGGSVGLVPFRMHTSESSPPASTVLGASSAPGPSSPIILRHYGPVTWTSLDAPVVVERRAIGTQGLWTDVTACVLVGREPGPTPSPRGIGVFPVASLPPGFTYRIQPVTSGPNRLQCDLGLALNPSVGASTTPYSITVLGGCDGDANGDGTVNFDDITSVLSAWGLTVLCDPTGDANFDGMVNFDDVTNVLANWNISCTAQVSVERGPAPNGAVMETLARRLGFADAERFQSWLGQIDDPTLRSRILMLALQSGGQTTVAGVEVPDE